MKDLPRQLRHLRSYYTAAPDPAAPRNYTSEMNQMLAGAQQTAGGYYGLDQEYSPLYTALNLGNAAESAYGVNGPNGHTQGTLELGRTAANYQRAGDLSDVGQMGSGVTAAQLNANPFLAQGLMGMTGRMNNSGVLNTLNTQAQTALNSGGQLSPQDQRTITQQSRGDFADRGMVNTNSSIVADAMNRDSAVRQRLAAAQTLGQNVQGLNAQQNDFVRSATGTAATAVADPFNVLLGRSGGASGAQAYGQPVSSASNGMFSPTNNASYASSLFAGNQQAQYANNVNQANATNANVGTYAGIAAALLSDERLKTDVKTTGERTRDGIPVKEFRYKTDPAGRRFKGVMAQDVEKVRPDAVLVDKVSGVKAVRYDVLAAPFQQLLKAA